MYPEISCSICSVVYEYAMFFLISSVDKITDKHWEEVITDDSKSSNDDMQAWLHIPSRRETSKR